MVLSTQELLGGNSSYVRLSILKQLFLVILGAYLNLVVKSYTLTTLSSVMILQTFTIPSAIILSILFLKVKYKWNHYLSLLFCAGGFSLTVLNDFYLNKQEDGKEKNPFGTSALFGDLLVLGGSFFYALSNILQEYFLKTGADVFNYVSHLGLFGCLIALAESMIF